MTIIHKSEATRAQKILRRTFKRIGRKKILGGLLMLAAFGTIIHAASVTLSWNRSKDVAAKGYNVYFWNSNVATSNILFAAGEVSVGNLTNATVTNLVTGNTYTFAATTVDTSGVESLLSNEVNYKVPMTAAGGPTNHPPTLNAIATMVLNENAGSQTVNLTGITSGASNEVQTLTVTATSSNPGLIPNPVVSYTSSKTNGTLSFRPATNSYGATTITVNVNDGGASNNLTAQSFVVSVGLAQMKIATQKPFMLTVTGQIGHVYTIQATQDFKTWTNIGSVTLGGGGSINFTDTNAASYSRRFYRTQG